MSEEQVQQHVFSRTMSTCMSEQDARVMMVEEFYSTHKRVEGDGTERTPEVLDILSKVLSVLPQMETYPEYRIVEVKVIYR